MPDSLQSRSDDEQRRARQLLLIKIALAAAVALILILALTLSEEPGTSEPAPTAQVVKPISSALPDTPAGESIEDAAMRALKTSEEAAQIQSAVLAEQKSMPQTASGVAEETADPTAPVLGAPLAASMPSSGQAESSGRLVLGQQPATRAAQPAANRAAPRVALATPATPVTVPPPAPVASSVAPRPVPPNFLVQAGVFANHGNAEELRNRLVAAGIPAQIESRVQVGPFGTKQEALAAQQKLRALGLDGGMLVPRPSAK